MSDPEATSDAASPTDAARQVDALASLVGLTISAAQRPGVVRFLSLAGTMAALVHSVPLPEDSLDLAPVFRPGAADGRET
ncbi:MAG: DUF4089 domain-containing protein [Microvirga sp.]